MGDRIDAFGQQLQADLRSGGGLSQQEFGQRAEQFRALQQTLRADGPQMARLHQYVAQTFSPEVTAALYSGNWSDYRGPRESAPSSTPGLFSPPSGPAEARIQPAARADIAKAGKIADALANPSPEARELLESGGYDLKLDSRGRLVADPAAVTPRVPTRGVSLERTERGGMALALDNDSITRGRWVNLSFNEVLTRRLGPERAAQEASRLREAGYEDLDMPRPFMVVSGARDEDPIYLGFSRNASNRGVVSICNDVGIGDFANGGSITLRKPVVYLYPEKKTNVTVALDVKGDFVSVYPALADGKWSMVATPDGTLFDAKTERRYPYLFWEADTAGFQLSLRNAHCVPRAEAAAFLERVAHAYALNPKEATDFITYWLPALERNAYSVVELLSPSAIENYAKMTIEPAPDTVNRLYMLFQGAAEPVAVGAPELPSLQRRGFTVVEWGGANLDERL